MICEFSNENNYAKLIKKIFHSRLLKTALNRIFFFTISSNWKTSNLYLVPEDVYKKEKGM